jgi:hypothetical protein
MNLISLKTYVAIKKNSETVGRMVFVCHLEVNQTPDFFVPISAQSIKQAWKIPAFLATIASYSQKTLLIIKKLQKQTP